MVLKTGARYDHCLVQPVTFHKVQNFRAAFLKTSQSKWVWMKYITVLMPKTTIHFPSESLHWSMAYAVKVLIF